MCCWFLVALAAFSDYTALTVLPVILPSLRAHWDIHPAFETLLTLAVFGAYALFSVVFGGAADKIGRKPVTIAALSVMGLAQLVAAAAPNRYVFISANVVIGAMIGLNFGVIATGYATEFAHSRYAIGGITVLVVASFSSVAVVNVAAWALLARIGWRWFLVVTVAPLIPALVLVVILPESPHFLAAHGNYEKAVRALRCLAALNRTRLPGKVMVQVEHTREQRSPFRQLLGGGHTRNLLCLTLFYASSVFLEFALIQYLPLLFDTTAHSADKDLIRIAISSLASVAGTISALLLSNYLHLVLRVTTLVQIPILVLFLLPGSGCTLLVATANKALQALSSTLFWFLIPASFPTGIRSTATGFLNGWGKMGGVIGATTVPLLFHSSPHGALALLAASACLGAVGALLLRNNTEEDHGTSYSEI